MKRICALFLALTVISCDAADQGINAGSVDAAPADGGNESLQPFEEEFHMACVSEPNSTPPGFYGTTKITPDTYCACIFDTAMRDLSDELRYDASIFALLSRFFVETLADFAQYATEQAR